MKVSIGFRKLIIAWAIIALASLLPEQSAWSQTVAAPKDTQTSIYDDVLQFGGPSSVAGQLAEDTTGAPEFRLQRLQDLAAPWYEFKERLNQRAGLQFGIDDSILYQVATDSLGETDAASGLVRVFGQWELVGRGSGNPGLLVFKGEDRHRIGTSLTPFDLGFEAGSVLPTGTFFSQFNFSVTNLFWKQYLFDRQMAIIVGRIDVTDFIDIYAMTNPLTHFLNLSFSLNPTIAAPNQGLGVAAGAMLTEHVYAQGGFSDANGQPTRAGFDTFFDDAEFFSYVEFGVTSAQDRIHLDNVHLTLWHTDARTDAGTPSSWGVAFTAQEFVCDKWLPFFRAGYSDGGAALMQATVSTGLGYQRENRDVAAFGFSWGKPATGALRDQYTLETFYRFQMTEYLAVTPDVQLVIDPALNSSVDALAFFGLRLRTAF